jgi:aspartate-semialdehyde dehydrogenase
MSTDERHSQRLVIAGASSLLGAELKSLLEESRFAGWDFRLVDEELAAGTLTEAGGEPVVIQPVDEGSFEKARFVFFAGSAEFTSSNLAAALRSGATVLDLTGMQADREKSIPWFPELEGKALVRSGKERFFSVLGAPGAGAVLFSLALQSIGLKRLSVTCFQSVSEAGRDGIEELEAQTLKLLSFQPIGKAVFDTQVAFTLLDQYGEESRRKLQTDLSKIRSQVRQTLGSRGVIPSLTLLHAPVFYGTTFSACAELEPTANQEAIANACEAAGFDLSQAQDLVGSVSVAGQNKLLLSKPASEPGQPGIWWFWGAADNIRFPAWNAVKLAEKLV